MALGRRAVVELDQVGAASARTGTRTDGPDPGSHRDPVPLQGGAHRLRIARMIGRREARTGLDDRGRHAEPHVDLGKLAAGRPAAQDDQALRQLPGQRRLPVRPRSGPREPLDRGPLRDGTDGHDDVPGGQRMGDPVVTDRHATATDDRAGPAVDDGSGTFETADVPGVVGFLGVGRPVDHVIPLGRRGGPVVPGGIGRMPRGTVQQRLRWQATDVGTAATEPEPVDHRDRRAELARLVRGGLTGRPGADDHEIVGIHGSTLARCVDGELTGRRAAVEPRRGARRH